MMTEPDSSRSAGATRVARSLPNRLARGAVVLFRDLELHSPRTLLLVWSVGRLVVFLVWGLVTPETQGDVVYYYRHIDFMFETGPEQTMREYPTPVLWLLAVPWLLGFGAQQGYVIAFVGLMLLLDIAFSLSLWRGGGRLRAHAVVFWTIFIVFIGPTVYLRFDLITSVLAGWSLLLVARGAWAWSGALAGMGAAIKLWPALLWPALCGGSNRQMLRASLGFWGTGGMLALVSLLWAGWDRLVSPLGWQSGRGLQVESVWASIPMLGRALNLGDYAVTISRYQAFEIYGTGVPFWTGAATVATTLGLLAVVVAYALWWIRGNGNASEAAALMLLVILVMIVTNKTFSPQYMIWLGGPQAAGFALLGNRSPDTIGYSIERHRLWIISLAILVSTVLTGIVFPIGYDPLVRDTWLARWFRLPVTLVLVARNVVITALLGYVGWWVAGSVRPHRVRK
ncbi:MAG: glycosyltransferase family 87 protein [Brooklawnia sp.]|uniref:glycosyltransferase 87 family protein n=1 Tax=Brooklawnia sp. TaxID=2699740 RepID=UPI003C732514